MRQFLIRIVFFISFCFCAFTLAQPATTETTAQLRARAEARCKLATQRFVRDKDAEASRKEFEEVAKIDPSYAMPLFFLGTLAEEQKKPEEAIRYYEQFVALDTTSDYYVQAQLRLDELKGKAKPATQPAEPAKTEAPRAASTTTPTQDAERRQQARVLSQQAEELVKADKTAEAAAKFEEAYRLDPTDERSGLRAAMAYGAVAQYERAFPLARRLSLSSDINIGNQASQALRAINISHEDQTKTLKKLAAEGEGWAAASLSMIYVWAALSDEGRVWHERPHESQRNFVDSVMWAKRAIELDHPRGRTILAWHMWRGSSGEKDVAGSIKLLKHAESQGDLLARVMRAGFYFAYLYEKGEPEEWKGKANEYATTLVSLAESGYFPAVLQVGKSIRGTIDKDNNVKFYYGVSNALMDGFENRANDLLNDATKSGYLLAQVRLAISIVNPSVRVESAFRATDSDSKEFLRLLEDAAGRGHIPAMYNLATVFDCGNATAAISRNEIQANSWISMLADLGEDYAAYELSYRYYNGVDGCVKDESRGLRYLKKAAELGHRDAKRLVSSNGTPMHSEGYFSSFMH